MIDVFGVTPSCRINWTPMIAPKIARTISSAKGRGGECRGVRLIGRAVFGFGLDVGHFLVPVSGGARADFPLDAAAKLSFRRIQIVMRLPVDPKIRRGAEIARQTKCGVSGNAAATQHVVIDPRALRPRRERPRHRRAADQRDELAPLHRANPKIQGSWQYSRSRRCIAAKAATHVRFGSGADITRSPSNVRFAPESGH